MSAIRPLATVTLLLLLGYILYARINSPDLQSADQTEMAMAGDPLIDLGQAAQPGQQATASASPPFFSPSATESVSTTMTAAPSLSSPPRSFTANAVRSDESVDAAASNQLAPAQSKTQAPDLPPLPMHIPTAKYGEAASSLASEQSDKTSSTENKTLPRIESSVEPLEASTPTATSQNNENITAAIPSVPPLMAETPSSLKAPAAEDSSRYGASGYGAPSRYESGDRYAAADRYAAEQEAATLSERSDLPLAAGQEFTQPSSAFADARPAIDAALSRGELKRAHLLLTGWYGDPSLTAAERSEVEQLLSQLAGTVIYSTEHHLEKPHIVTAGETLPAIAEQYNVPWQLLAKINGIADPDGVQPGESLKVVRGPFHAVVDVQRQELALMVSDHYAGRFSVKTEGAATQEGEWRVADKTVADMSGKTMQQVVLRGGSGESIVLGTASATSPEPTAGAIRVSPRDQQDLYDILSVGSSVMIR